MHYYFAQASRLLVAHALNSSLAAPHPYELWRRGWGSHTFTTSFSMLPWNTSYFLSSHYACTSCVTKDESSIYTVLLKKSKAHNESGRCDRMHLLRELCVDYSHKLVELWHKPVCSLLATPEYTTKASCTELQMPEPRLLRYAD